MAYQQQGMGNSAGGGQEHHGPQGTEYTLQGVMRFLQIEWHNHERARNAWDIERAEMKAKIAKQEGETRHARRLNEQLDRQVRMLEKVLKDERAKSKGQKAPDAPDATSSALDPNEDAKGKNHVRPDSVTASKNHHNSFLDIHDAAERTQVDREAERDKSRLYLERCVQEITYLLTPPAHPPPPQTNMQPAYTGIPDPPLSMDEMYMQHRQKRQHEAGQVTSHQTSIPNHQPPPVPQMPDNRGNTAELQEAPYMTREAPYQQQYSRVSESRSEAPVQENNIRSVPHEEQVERVTHSYDAYGRLISAQEDEHAQSRSQIKEETDGWNFDESSAQSDVPPYEAVPSRRPDTDLFPAATNIPAKSPPRTGGPGSHRRRSSGSSGLSRRRSSGSHDADALAAEAAKADERNFKVRFALRGHLDVVRAVVFTGGGSPSEPEICTAGDDSTIKRWIIPASYGNFGQHVKGDDLDIPSYFTHRGHEGIVTSLAVCPASTGFSTGGRASGDGWIFSGGQDATVRVWERGRVDPKATLDGHTDAIWSVCVLPGTTGTVFGAACNAYGGPDRILLASGSADGSVRIWAVSAPPQSQTPSTGSRRGVGGSRRHSVTSGSNFPNSPQPSVASSTPFSHTLVHHIEREEASPTCITPLGTGGETFVVSYTDSSILVFDTRTGEEIIGMASNETYDRTMDTSINTVVATSLGLEGVPTDAARIEGGGEEVGAGATGGGATGVEGVVISGHEDRYVRFFDANSDTDKYAKVNALTQCLPTPPPSPPYPSHPMVAKPSPLVTTPVSGSGALKSAFVHKKSPAIGPCAERAFAVLFGAKTVDTS
ncbi:1,2-dihydroxy-3-keto-5-methylthiopentene dioxygenase [Elasticomyces elasticus]|nr:1,2-dihydroxy-3-keto-5-methylthiopentene dioxygenase [Elasticomyces elasticus]